LYGQTDSFITPPYTLSGTVVSGINNEPLYGAHLLSSKRLATKTNETGLFDIIVTENDTLKISYIGFKTLIFIAPKNNEGKYLTKFTLYKDSISLKEVEIFPWPSYDDFKKAFEELDFKDQEIKMAGVKMYQDRNIEPWEFSMLNLFTNPLTLMYDRLLDKKAKLNRRINRRREIIEKAAQKQSLEN
jgi:hypothetical protein